MDAFLLQILGELSKSGYNVVSLLQKSSLQYDIVNIIVKKILCCCKLAWSIFIKLDFLFMTVFVYDKHIINVITMNVCIWDNYNSTSYITLMSEQKAALSDIR